MIQDAKLEIWTSEYDAFIALKYTSQIYMEFSIRVPQKYDMLASVHSWIYPNIQPVPEKTWDRNFGRMLTVAGKELPIVVSQNRIGGTLLVNSDAPKEDKNTLKKKIQRVLGLNLDTSSALALLAENSVFEDFVDRLVGIRPYTTDTVFEGLIKTIIQQQISYKAANVLTKRMTLALSKPTKYNGIDLYQFPSREAIIKRGVEGLKKFGLGYKAAYVNGVSEFTRTMTPQLETLSNCSYEEVVSLLKPVRGIGEWTIQALAIASLGNFSVFPYGDLAIQNVLGRLYEKEKRFSRKETQKLAETWGNDGPLILYLLMTAEVLGYI
ncbi:MAG: DNA-3-methyladenine glycosylase family protein [Candidatus Thorarchaeota archaeon]